MAGEPNKVIALDLGISIRTVESHRASIMDKTEATTLVDLVHLSLALRKRGLMRLLRGCEQIDSAATIVTGARPIRS